MKSLIQTKKQPKNYEILSHTADLKIKVFGKTKKELFLNALQALNDSIKPKIIEKEEKRTTVKIRSIDLPGLLVDFLNKILYLTQVNKEIYTRVEFEKLSDTEIDARFISDAKIDFVGEDIKAATYHDLEIKKNKNGSWETTILFDI